MPTLQQSKHSPSVPVLSDRLRAIARGLPKNGVICDVGSDHGALPLYLLSEGLCRRAIVTDLNEAPLNRARLALEGAGVAGVADFVLTDGILDVLPMRPDAFVIAGMGGDTIAGILSRGLPQLKPGAYFALQPMTKEERLRAFLCRNGFLIEDEISVCENGKVFLILFVRYDAVIRELDALSMLVGEHIPNRCDEASRAYLLKVTAKMKTRLKGLQRDSLKNSDEIALIKNYLLYLEDMNESSRDRSLF